MKQYIERILILALLTMVLQVNAQEEYKFRTNPANAEPDVVLSADGNFLALVGSAYEAYDADPLLCYNTDAAIERLNADLWEVRLKVIQWTATAKLNNVTKLAKEVRTLEPCFMMWGSSNSIAVVSPVAKFIVMEDAKGMVYGISINLPAATARQNEYITHKGGAYVLLSIKELEELIRLTSKEHRAELAGKAKAKDDLFK